jgi:hypothetical protein
VVSPSRARIVEAADLHEALVSTVSQSTSGGDNVFPDGPWRQMLQGSPAGQRLETSGFRWPAKAGCGPQFADAQVSLKVGYHTDGTYGIMAHATGGAEARVLRMALPARDPTQICWWLPYR